MDSNNYSSDNSLNDSSSSSDSTEYEQYEKKCFIPFSRFNPEPGFRPEDYGSGTDSSDSEDIENKRLDKLMSDLRDKELSELRELILQTLVSKSVKNILMLQRENGWNDKDSLWYKFHEFEKYFENDSWVPGSEENHDGPPCHICQKIIISHFIPVDLNNVTYWYCHEDMVEDKVEETRPKKVAKKFGLLQCVYCFNFFHRWKCSLSMNKKSYINKMLDRSWACASCVPVFIPRAKNKAKKVNKQDKDKNKVLLEYLRKIFTELYKIGFNMNMNVFVNDEYIDLLIEKVDNVLELYDNG
jgi:hypothetical protein